MFLRVNDLLNNLKNTYPAHQSSNTQICNKEIFRAHFRKHNKRNIIATTRLLDITTFHTNHRTRTFPDFKSRHAKTPIISCYQVSSQPVHSQRPIIIPSTLVVRSAALLRRASIFTNLTSSKCVIVGSAESIPRLNVNRVLTNHSPTQIVAIPTAQVTVRRLKHPLPGLILLKTFTTLAKLIKLISIRTTTKRQFRKTILRKGYTTTHRTCSIIGTRINRKINSTVTTISTKTPIFSEGSTSTWTSQEVNHDYPNNHPNAAKNRLHMPSLATSPRHENTINRHRIQQPTTLQIHRYQR